MPWIDEKEYYGWLDGYKEHGLVFEDWQIAKRAGIKMRGAGGGTVQEESQTRHIGIVDFNDSEAIEITLSWAQRQFQDRDHEFNVSITKDGKEWVSEGIPGSVNLDGITSNIEGSYSYHNHPETETNGSFSGEGVGSFISNKEASDNEYEYLMTRTDDTIELDYDVVYNMFIERYPDALEIVSKNDGNADMDVYHETMKLLAEKLRFTYERKKIE